MILGDPASAAAKPADSAGSVTIDDIFRGHAGRRPDAIALIDPADRESFTDGAPRQLSYAEADRIVGAIAGRLHEMGLPADTVVGVQMPNIVETMLVTLAVLRAGMIVATVPLLCRRADAVTALARIGAKALFTCGRVGSFNHGAFAMAVAADVFSVRYVCGFGADLPDGIVSFDDLLDGSGQTPFAPPERQRTDASAHVAGITFDIADGGLVPVARTHAELLAGGLAVLVESRLPQDSNIVSTIAPSSFAGMCLTLLPWLLCGGTLTLHHPFDGAVLARASRERLCDALVLPAPVAFHLADTDPFALDGVARVIAAWRSPERLSFSPAWRQAATAALVDVPIFGEIALAPARRDDGGRPESIPLGAVSAPRGGGGVLVAETMRTGAGTLAVRGPMVPHHAFPPGIEGSGLPYFKIGAGGFVDSGYACRADTLGHGLVVTAPPAGTASVGGYRFALRDLREIVARVDPTATLLALPHPIIGQRLIGNAADRATMRAALDVVGINPIVVGSFRDRTAWGADDENHLPATAVG